MKARAAITINTATCFSPGFLVVMSPLLSVRSIAAHRMRRLIPHPTNPRRPRPNVLPLLIRHESLSRLLPKPPLSRLIASDRPQEVDLPEGRPIRIAEIEFGVGTLPEH